jgi:hypothetical protein
MLIHRQNLYAPRSRRFTGRRDAQSSKPANKDMNLPVYNSIPVNLVHDLSLLAYDMIRYNYIP